MPGPCAHAHMPHAQIVTSQQPVGFRVHHQQTKCGVGQELQEAASMAIMRARATAATLVSSLLLSSLLLLFAAPSLSLDLCDESDCANNTDDLEICRPFGSFNKTPLYLMGFFPCNTRVRARGLTVAAQMAIRAVEKNNSILPNYSMRLSFNNTMVSLECLQWAGKQLCKV